MADIVKMYKDAFAIYVSGELDAAIGAFKQVIEADSQFALAHQGIAEVYARLDRLDEAIDAIQRAIDAEPTESLYYTSLSRFLQRQGKIPEAEAAAADAQRVQSSGGS